MDIWVVKQRLRAERLATDRPTRATKALVWATGVLALATIVLVVANAYSQLSDGTDRATARRRRRPGSLPAPGFFARPRASRPVPAVRRQSQTDRTRPTAPWSRFGCPAHTAPSPRPTRVCRQVREPASICQPRYHRPTPRHGTPRHPRALPTLDATRHRGPLSANRSPFAPTVEPPPPGLFRRGYPESAHGLRQISIFEHNFGHPR